MPETPPTKNLLWTCLGLLYRFTYLTSRQNVLGLSWSWLVKGAGLGLLLAAWWYGGEMGLLVLVGLLNLYIWFVYWRGKRIGYRRFIAADQPPVPGGEVAMMAPETAVPLLVTGLMGSAWREADLLLCPAEYWQTPGGDHLVMARRGRKKVMYQFFNATSLQMMQWGWLLHGRELWPTLAITFKLTWGPNLEGKIHVMAGADFSQFKSPSRTIYLTFPEPTAGTRVWHNIVADARLARQRPLSD